MFNLIFDYGGVVVGLLLLLIATYFLPGKIRIYVLTAGIPLIVFRAYQIFTTKKKLQEADKIRDTLKKQHSLLQQRMKALEKNTEQLHKQKTTIEKEYKNLKEQSEHLASGSESELHKKQELDKKANALLEETKTVTDKRNAHIEALQAAAKLAKQFAVH